MIPEISNQKWKSLIAGEITPKIKSFSLQMKLNTLNKQYKVGAISIGQAIKELHDLCGKYEKIYTEDLKQIFN